MSNLIKPRVTGFKFGMGRLSIVQMEIKHKRKRIDLVDSKQRSSTHASTYTEKVIKLPFQTRISNDLTNAHRDDALTTQVSND